MNKILNYFPNLTDTQKKQIADLYDLYVYWNERINVISRKDIENLYEHHVLHSMAIAKLLSFKNGTHILDVGTGGGFPGIPLAILFPECQFFLADSIGKKIKVATAVSETIGLKNVTLKQTRVEELKEKFDFIVSRAVMPLDDIIKFTFKNISSTDNNALPNGWICLKGGELEKEIGKYQSVASVYDISEFYNEDYFTTKKMVYLPYTGKKHG